MISELDEDDDGKTGPGIGHSIEELSKIFTKYAVPKGLARTSLVIGFERHSAGKGPPKKAINRASYRFVQVMLDEKTDATTFLAFYKEFHDRMDGKAAQAVNLGNHEGGALTLIVGQADTNVL